MPRWLNHHAGWLYSPLLLYWISEVSTSAAHSLEIAQQYDLFQTTLDTLQKSRGFLNFGYNVARGQTYEDRQARLCLEVFKAAMIRRQDVIIDVGFGSGEQDFLLARTYQFAHLLGFNIASRQVRSANHRARQEGLTHKLAFRLGEAERLHGVADDAADVVLAIECAFYFDRPRFYHRAATVLKPGGRLVVADITLSDWLGRMVRGRPGLRYVGTATTNRAAWEQHFHTRSVRRINAQTWTGAQITVLQILRTLLTSTLTQAERRAWWKLAREVQVMAVGLSMRLLRYDLLVLAKGR